MTKLVQNDITSLVNEQSALAALNANYAALEAFSDSVLSRDGTSPNPMLADLDMNSHKILNIGDPLDMNHASIIGLDDGVALDEPVTVNQLNNAILSGGGAISTAPYITVTNNAFLPNERSLAVGAGLTSVDAGANATITLDLANNGVTYAKMQDITTDSLIGRDTAGTGDPETITLGASLSMTGAQVLQRAALTGDVTATAGSNATVIANDAVTFAKMQNIATDSLIGRDTAATGDPENITLDTTLQMSGAQVLQRAALTGDITASAGSNATTIPNNTVTYAKMQDVSATSRFLGRITAGAGDPEELTGTQATSLLNAFTSVLPGLATASGGGTTNFLRADGSWVAAGGGASGNMTRRTITTTDTIVSGDKGNVVEATSGTFTLAFTAAATLASGFWCIVTNSGTGDVTLDPNGAELIDGLTTWVLYTGGTILLICTGTAFETILISPMRKIFTGSGTFTKPGAGTSVLLEAWGAGGSGGRGGTGEGGGGGGAGAYVTRPQVSFSTLGTTETVTIGGGGTAITTNDTSGNAGGNTTIGSLLTAFGGGAGGGAGAGATFFGGGGGGGNETVGGNGGVDTEGTAGGLTQTTTASNVSGGGIGGANANTSKSVFGGAGGGDGGIGATVGNAGSTSFFGGGGGGGGSSAGAAGAGGTSRYAGNGGAGANAGNTATAGTQPSGGGGGSCTGNSGAGAAGQVVITVW